MPPPQLRDLSEEDLTWLSKLKYNNSALLGLKRWSHDHEELEMALETIHTLKTLLASKHMGAKAYIREHSPINRLWDPVTIDGLDSVAAEIERRDEMDSVGSLSSSQDYAKLLPYGTSVLSGPMRKCPTDRLRLRTILLKSELRRRKEADTIRMLPRGENDVEKMAKHALEHLDMDELQDVLDLTAGEMERRPKQVKKVVGKPGMSEEERRRSRWPSKQRKYCKYYHERPGGNPVTSATNPITTLYRPKDMVTFSDDLLKSQYIMMVTEICNRNINISVNPPQTQTHSQKRVEHRPDQLAESAIRRTPSLREWRRKKGSCRFIFGK
ncbi:hypothetical protein OQA88_421 [Cercophora sp. LCS_1]